MRGNIGVGKTAVLRPLGRNGDRRDWLCGCTEDRLAGVIPAAAVGRVITESAGARRLAAFGGRPGRAGGCCMNLSESAGARILAGTPCYSMQAGLLLLLIQVIQFSPLIV
jgi:hypothetical protein